MGSLLGTRHFPPTFDRQAEAGGIRRVAKRLVQLGGLGTGEAHGTSRERNRSAPISLITSCKWWVCKLSCKLGSLHPTAQHETWAF